MFVRHYWLKICSTDEGFNQFPSFIQGAAITNQLNKSKKWVKTHYEIAVFSRDVQKMGIQSFKDAKCNECRNQNFLLKPNGTKIRMRLHSYFGPQVVIEKWH